MRRGKEDGRETVDAVGNVYRERKRWKDIKGAQYEKKEQKKRRENVKKQEDRREDKRKETKNENRPQKRDKTRKN